MGTDLRGGSSQPPTGLGSWLPWVLSVGVGVDLWKHTGL